MRAGDKDAWPCRSFEEHLTARTGLCLVGVIFPGELRPRELDGWHMHDIPPDQQLALPARNLEHRMPHFVAVCCNRSNALADRETVFSSDTSGMIPRQPLVPAEKGYFLLRDVQVGQVREC